MRRRGTSSSDSVRIDGRALVETATGIVMRADRTPLVRRVLVVAGADISAAEIARELRELADLVRDASLGMTRETV